MKRSIYAGSLLAVTVGAFGTAAEAQQACQGDVLQLERQLERSQVDEGMRREIEQLLARAQSADAQACDGYIEAARQRLSRAEQSGAQQSAQQQPSQARQQAAQQQQRQGQADRTTDIQVEQQPAQVEVDAGAPEVAVQQRAPEVTVEQPPPEVTITQPEPEVTVQQAEPQVTVQQGEPQVQVRQAEPQVQVEQGGEPDVRVVEPESERQSQQRQSQQRQQAATGAAISEAEATQLVGNSVRTRQGEDVGEVSTVARSRADQELYVLTDVGGFFGIGERTVAIPLQQAEVDEEGNLITEMTREQLEQLREADPNQFAAVR